MGKTTEFIDREKARDIVCSLFRWEGTSNCVECEHPIDDFPAADVVEVRHGRWNNGYEVQNCSECGYRGKRSYKYCPHCGARMDGGADK